MSRTHLVIGDSHSIPGQDLRRYDALGEFIDEVRPDVVVDMGDWSDCQSLGKYDRGKASFEGRRYSADVATAHEARGRVDSRIKKLRRKPKRIALEGNHEARADTYADEHPELQKVISSKDFKPRLWDWIPFGQEIEIDGVAYSHIFPTGVMNKPPSGDRPAWRLLTTQHRSCVMAHTHTLDNVVRSSGKRKLQCWVAGCYVEPSWRPSYAGAGRNMWTSGLLILRNIENGYARDWQWVSFETVLGTGFRTKG